MKLMWIKNFQNNSWFDLLRLNLNSSYFNNLHGVYIIWYTNAAGGKVIKIHSGLIGENLRSDKVNPEILKYSSFGPLKVTWTTEVSTSNIYGVIAYLNEKYNPIMGDPVPVDTPPIEVNLIGE